MSRRKFLASGASLLAAALVLPGRAFSQPGDLSPIRIGFVLPSGGGRGEAPFHQRVGAAARMGAVMAGEEIGFNAQLLGWPLEVLPVEAGTTDEAARTAVSLVRDEGACALVGGLAPGHAQVMSQVSADHGAPFFNIGDPSDALRGAFCQRFTFHVEASAAMYLDALVAWFVRAGHRRWFIVREESREGDGRYSRAVRAITGRHWGAREVGRAVVPAGGAGLESVLESIRRTEPDVVLLLLSAEDQLAFFSRYEALGVEAMVAGFPEPVTQTRGYFQQLLATAPRSGAGYRATLWETTLDAYGARELNARFTARWSAAMEGSAWAAYASVKILFESVLAVGSQDGQRIVEHLEAPGTVFDVYKGIGVSFRPWDHQLRQSIYLVKIRDAVEAGTNVESQRNMGLLVGQLPEIYMPGTDPIERLDQLGDLATETRCRFVWSQGGRRPAVWSGRPRGIPSESAG